MYSSSSGLLCAFLGEHLGLVYTYAGIFEGFFNAVCPFVGLRTDIEITKTGALWKTPVKIFRKLCFALKIILLLFFLFYLSP